MVGKESNKGSPWNFLKKGEEALEAAQSYGPQLEKLKTQLLTIQQGLEKRPESAEQFLPGLETIQSGLQRASKVPGLASHVKPVLSQIDQTIQALRAQDWPTALRSVKNAVGAVNSLIHEVHHS